MSDDERVRVEISDHLAEVTLVRPDKHNGLDYAMFEAIGAAIDEVRAASGVRAVVLAAEGPSFSAGLDFASFIAEGRPVEEMLAPRDGGPSNFAQYVAVGWRAIEAPVIAAIDGNCLGGGCQIALGADIRIGGPALKMSILEIKWGLIPDMGITTNLPRLVGIDLAKQLTFTGRVLAAAEADALGLVTELASDPLERAHELAAEIVARSPDAIRSGKRLFDEAWTADPAPSLALERELQTGLLATPNQIAAVGAAISGEPAQFED